MLLIFSYVGNHTELHFYESRDNLLSLTSYREKIAEAFPYKREIYKESIDYNNDLNHWLNHLELDKLKTILDVRNIVECKHIDNAEDHIERMFVLFNRFVISDNRNRYE